MYLEIVLPLILNLPYNIIKARRRRVIKDWKRSLAKKNATIPLEFSVRLTRWHNHQVFSSERKGLIAQGKQF